jgi:uncharacterized membrane protein
VGVYEISVLVLYLAIYSFLGWIVEVGYVFATTQKLENRGFLTGPFLPIYGVGAVLLVLLVLPYVKNPFLVFLASFLITTALEFVTHLALDKIFHIRLWDYSDKPFNIRGRVCLQNSLLFGVLGLLLIYVLHPFASGLIALLPQPAAIAVASSLLGILVIDGANSLLSLGKVRPELDKMKGSLAQVHAKIEADARARAAKDAARRSAFESDHAFTIARLTRNFPRARSAASSATPGKSA